MATVQPEGIHRGLRVETVESKEAMVVKCSGRLTAELSPMLKEEVKRLIPTSKRIVLDLGELSYMDSSGLGAVVGLFITARKSGCAVRVTNMSPRIRELLGITRLLESLEDHSPKK